MKRFEKHATTLFLLLAALAMTACRANLGNFFDLY